MDLIKKNTDILAYFIENHGYWCNKSVLKYDTESAVCQKQKALLTAVILYMFTFVEALLPYGW